MSFEDATFDAAQFTGRVRLFPLPNLVMFPHVLQPLHVFEPRYRSLTEEALADDRLMAMAVLAPGWEGEYEGRPPLMSHACLGRILTHQSVEGGRYNLLLAGMKRIRIVRELPPNKLFREAEVELVEDVYPPAAAADRPTLQRSLLESFKHMLPNMPEVHQQLEELLCTEVSLGMLTDLVAYTLKLSIEAKATLLGEADVDRRCRVLLRCLDEPGAAIQPPTLKGPAVKWPPDFSKN
jgi:ATP-dependent Lon protease